MVRKILKKWQFHWSIWRHKKELVLIYKHVITSRPFPTKAIIMFDRSQTLALTNIANLAEIQKSQYNIFQVKSFLKKLNINSRPSETNWCRRISFYLSTHNLPNNRYPIHGTNWSFHYSNYDTSQLSNNITSKTKYLNAITTAQILTVIAAAASNNNKTYGTCQIKMTKAMCTPIDNNCHSCRCGQWAYCYQNQCWLYIQDTRRTVINTRMK